MTSIVGRGTWGYRQRRQIAAAPRSRTGLVLHYSAGPEHTGPRAPQFLQDVAFARGFAALLVVSLGWTVAGVATGTWWATIGGGVLLSIAIVGMGLTVE